MDTNANLWEIAENAAFRVEFLTTGRELFLYTSAIHSAMMWGWGKSLEEREMKDSEERDII